MTRNRLINIRDSAGLLSALLSCCLLSFAITDASAQELLFSGDNRYENLVFDPVYIEAGHALPDTYSGNTGSGTGGADTATEADSESLLTIRRYRDSIRDIEYEQGLFSDSLRQQYQDLAQLQQAFGLHEDAIESYTQSMHIARVNQGLFTEQQISDIESIITSLQQLHDNEREEEYRAYLYYVQSRAYPEGDPRLDTARRAWADWNIENYRIQSFHRPNAIRIRGSSISREFLAIRNTLTGQVRFIDRNSLGMSGQSTTYTPEMIIDDRIHTVRDIYGSFQENAEDASLSEKLAIQVKLMEADYALKSQFDRFTDSSNSYVANSFFTSQRREMSVISRDFRKRVEALENLLAEASEQDPAETVLQAKVNLYLGDLHVVYNRAQTSEKYYLAARKLFLENGMSETEVRRQMLPETYYPLPDFSPVPYSREYLGIADGDMQEFQGYIDVRFTISPQGNVRKSEITGASEETPQRVRSRLLNYLRNQKMRPLIEEDGPREQEDIKLRFYYSY